MSETKTHRNERLKAMRRKYHLGEFQNSASHSIKSHGRLNRMAKRTRRHARRSSGFGSGMTGQFTGAAGYILFEALGEKYIPLNGMALNIAELALGAYFSKRSGILGSVGKTAVVINAYQILQPLMSGLTSGGSISLFN